MIEVLHFQKEITKEATLLLLSSSHSRTLEGEKSKGLYL